jgi:hypothetical protein
MACLCKNPDGSLAQCCIGTCEQKSFYEGNAVELMKTKSIQDNIEYVLGKFLDKTDMRIERLERCTEQKYNEGFKDGFELAREIYD